MLDGDNPLDASAVHPERYAIVQKMAQKLNLPTHKLIGNTVTTTLQLEGFVTEEVGLITLTDIINELQKPGLDPRGAAKTMEFDDRIRDIKDIRTGMILQGKVSNLTKFGAFVDIGVKENGLIHVSQITDKYITDPAEHLSLEQVVTVKVIEVDLDRKRIALSMKM